MISFKNLSKRERWIAGVTGVVISLLIADRLVIRPLAHSWTMINQRIEADEMKLMKNMRLVSLERDLKEELKVFDARKKEAIADMRFQVEFLKNIEQFARKSGVRITALKPLPPLETDLCISYGADIELESGMASLTEFLYALKTKAKYIKIEKLSIRQPLQGSTALKSRVILSKFAL